MFEVILRTVRTRRHLFIGTFIALTFSIAVMSGMFNLIMTSERQRPLAGSPTRYDATAIIIEADQKIHVTQEDGSEQTATLKDRRFLDADAADALASVSGISRSITDRSFPAAIIKSGARQPERKGMGHGWSSAELTPFHLTVGSAPKTGQIVVTEAIAHAAGIQVGETVPVVTPFGVQQFWVAGIARTSYSDHLPGEDTLFFEDTQAAELSGAPDKANAIGVITKAGQSIEKVRKDIVNVLPGKTLKVQTGPDKGGNVAADLYAVAVTPIIEIAGFNITTAGFVCIFVVAATVAFSIAQRRQEIALLRLVGASPRQIRRMILGETIVIALVSGIVGSLLGIFLGRVFSSALKHYELAPREFMASGTLRGALIASGIGMGVALLGVYFASRRAGKVRAVEAMRDAAAEQRVMTKGRWIMGILFLLISAGMIFLMMTLAGVAAIAMAIVVTEVLAVALALLMPVFVRPVITFMTAPLTASTTALGMLVQANLRSAVRRTTAIAAPILVAVSITVSFVGSSVLASSADRLNIEQRMLATHVISAQDGGIPYSTVQSLRNVPGVTSLVSAPSTAVFYPSSDLSSSQRYGLIDPDLLQVFDIEVVEGSLQNTHKDGAIVTVFKAQEMGWKLGQKVPVFLTDGSQVSLRVAAIVNMPIVLSEILISPDLHKEHTDDNMVKNVFLRLDNDYSHNKAAQHELQNLATRAGTHLQDKAAWLASNAEYEKRDRQVAMIMVLGLALAYLTIAIVNTSLMAASARSRDIALLRKVGASRKQILSMIIWETIVVVATASLSAIAIAYMAIWGVHQAFKQIIPGISLPLAEPVYLIVIGGGFVVALLASIAPTLLQLRERS